MLRKTLMTSATLILYTYAALLYAKGGDEVAFTNKMGYPIVLEKYFTSLNCDAGHNHYPNETVLEPDQTKAFFIHAESQMECGVSILVTASANTYLSAGTVSFDLNESGHFYSLTEKGWNYLYTSGVTAVGPILDKSHKNYWVYEIQLYQPL